MEEESSEEPRESDGEDSTSEEPRSSESSPDKVKSALPSKEVLTPSLDADGPEDGQVPDLSRETSDSETETDAMSTLLVNSRRESAGTGDSRESEPSREPEEPALSSEEPTDNSSGAELLEESEPE